MNSKEALENLGRINLGDNPYCIFEDNLLKNCYKEEYENIEKDLKVLETLKKFILVSKSYDDLFPYDIDVKQQYVSNKSCLILTEEEFHKIKEWLENDKI